MTGTGSDATGSEDQGRRAAWLRWAERIFWLALLAFLAVRLGPQVGAFTGISLPGGHDIVGTRPAFSVTTLAGETLDSEELRGWVVLVNVWATWCPPCRLEVPSLQALHEERAEDGLVVLGIARDRGAGARAEVEAFLAERDVTYPVALGGDAAVRALGGVPGLPTTFLLDRDGVVRHRVYGYFAPPAMKAAVDRLLER